jgi:uncharacterized protein (DUF2141 family)
MKTQIILVICIIFSLPAYAASIEVSINNLENNKGTLKYLLFNDPEGYPDRAEKSIRQGSIPATQQTLLLSDLEPGEYAMTFIHDENNNGKLDTRMGLPAESFGFSENPVIFFGPPAWSRSSFRLQDIKTLKIKMKSL